MKAGMLSFSRRLSLVTGVAVLVATCGLSFPVSGAEGERGSEYTMGPQDKVRVRAFEWRPSRDEVFEWSALNAEYVVGAGGKVSLPLVGEIVANDKTPAELAAAIGAGLKARIGLVEPPDVSVEVVQFRPLYIIGDVERPGEYAYRPNLTVLQAVSLAGGMARIRDPGVLRFERELISTKGDLTLLESEYAAIVARKARLDSELAGLEEIDLPRELQLSGQHISLIAMLHQERLLFQSRKAAVDTQVKALEQLKSLLEAEAASLAKQLATHDTQVRLMDEELANVAKLYSKGLSTAPRKMGLERNAAQLQGERLRLEASLARVNQEARKTDITILELRNKRLTEITAELRQTQAKMDELANRMETVKSLLDESRASAPRVFATGTDASQGEIEPGYIVVRGRSGRFIELKADEATLVQPGDTIKVESAASRDARLEMAKHRRTQKRSPQPDQSGARGPDPDGQEAAPARIRRSKPGPASRKADRGSSSPAWLADLGFGG